MGKILTLGNKTVQVLKGRSLKAEVAAADVVDGLVVDHERAVGVLESGVGSKDGVVRLNDGAGVLRSRVDAEFQLALLAVVEREALHKESTETRAGTTTEGVENKEALETRAAVGNAADLVKDGLDELLANSVVTTGVVVGGILLASDHELGVEEVTVGTGTGLIDDVGLEVAVNGARDVLALA